ncbi:MAG: DUF2961 domain-containing protein [Verrucomicrobia bacterium]|nr:MAG: DUF2961 domain-containing protein [Verrucomicrobiota bacterium]
MKKLYQMPENKVQSRWISLENKTGEKGAGGKANFGRKGSACTNLAAGETLVLADLKGSGTIRRIWITISERDAQATRGLKIEMFWDGASRPAAQGPIGDFFCHSQGRMLRFENACFSSPEARTFNCTIPMPFKESAKLQLVNESEKEITVFFDINCTLDEIHDGQMLYFHSYWRRENPTKTREDMAILPKISGKGRFLGCNLGVKINEQMNNFWWGEGEVKAYLDGDDEYPTLCGTGTEDYIGTGWGQGLFVNRFQGNHFIDAEDGKQVDDSTFAKAYGFYRFHIPDPVYFYEDIKVVIQVMGGAYYSALLECMDKNPGIKLMKAGDGTRYYTREELEARPEHAEVLERFDDYTATAYWYMDKPQNELPEIADVSERIKDLA